MLELHCTACGRANAVTDAQLLDDRRCAECEEALDEERPVRYFVADRGHSHGPLVYRDLVHGVAMRTLTPEMLLSEENGPWVLAAERSDLFPSSRPVARRSASRAPVPRKRAAAPPGPVQTMAVLQFLMGILFLVLSFVGLAFVASWGGVGEGYSVLLLLVVIGVGHILMAKGLRNRSVVARNLQLGLAGLAGLSLLVQLAEGQGGAFALLLGLFVAMPFPLLLNAEARAWFKGEDADA